MMNEPSPQPRRSPAIRMPTIRWGKIGPAFWTVACVLSLTVNLVLITILVALAAQIFSIKQVISDQLIDGLYQNFALMDEAHIRTVIPVRDQKVRATFTLEIDTPTTVRLSEDTLLSNAQVQRLSTGGLTIYNAPADIILRAGTELPILLNLEVPVDQEIPVNLDVHVDIPLRETDLHQPFTGLQAVLSPYRSMLGNTPNTWTQAVCGSDPLPLCLWLFGE